MNSSIKQEIISTNGIEMHVASIGNEDHTAILFLHGFPGLWFSWRRQLLLFSDLGFRCIAPDLRGYGETDSPISPSSYTLLHLVGDLVLLLDHFSIPRVFLVAHAWGAAIAWAFALFRPDRIVALVALSLPFIPRNPGDSSVESSRELFGNDRYHCTFEEPEVMEQEIIPLDPESIFRLYFSIHNPLNPFIPKDVEIGARPVPNSLPIWVSEEDITYYANKYRKNGFHGSFNYSRATQLNWELSAPWTGSKVEVPAMLIMGKLDFMYRVPSVMEYVQNGGMKRAVPMLEVVEIEGAAHFVHQDKPEEVSQHILDFIRNLSLTY